MCGICGVVHLRRNEFPKCMQERAIKLLKEIESRGKSAFGIYVYNPKFNLYVREERSDIIGHLFKIKGSVSSFFKDKEGKIDLKDSSIFLAHTRAPTNGSPDDNENNHPFNTKDFILAHNGVIGNHEELKKKYGLEYDSECDSAIIIHLIQHFYDLTHDVVESIRRTAEELSGSYACWLFHKETSDVYLFRHSNPIYYFVDKRNKCIVFASEFRHIDSIYDKKLTYSDVPSLPEDKIFVVNDDGLECVGEFKSDTSTTIKCSYGDKVSVEHYSVDSYESIPVVEEEFISDVKELRLLFNDFLLDHPEAYISMTLWDDALEIRISSKELYDYITKHEKLQDYIVMREPESHSLMIEVFAHELKKLLPYFRYAVKVGNEKTRRKEMLERFAKFLDGQATFVIKSARNTYEECVRFKFPKENYIKRLFQQFGLTLDKHYSIEIPLDENNRAYLSLVSLLATLKFR